MLDFTFQQRFLLEISILRIKVLKILNLNQLTNHLMQILKTLKHLANRIHQTKDSI